jgi:hypothetical protein
VIASYEQLEFRLKLKKVLSHKARLDRVATSECFEFRFGPTPPLISFNRSD